ncbi:hypothetical protein [Parasitella parasitica]|uniref:Uncharacterized protein n=1 Tax=Parasitella parasitica TaxID=35722 RepID=A0A0B7MWK9_9FUNG|nr:hypothetical protein [Parasitella parasitica]
MASLNHETTCSREYSGPREFAETHSFDDAYLNSQDLDVESEEFPLRESIFQEVHYDFYSHDQSYNQLLNYEATASPSSDVNFSSSVASLILKSVKHVDKVFLTEIATHFGDNLPPFSSIIDHDAYASEPSEEKEYAIERPRRDRHLYNESEVSSWLLQSEQGKDFANQSSSAGLFCLQPSQDDADRDKLVLHESQLERLANNQLFMFDNDYASQDRLPLNESQLERLAINQLFLFGDDYASRDALLLSESQHEQLESTQLFMFANIDGSKDFSSWFLFDSDDEDEIAFFKKNILGEEDATLKYFANRKNEVADTGNHQESQCVVPELTLNKASTSAKTTDAVYTKAQQAGENQEICIVRSSRTMDGQEVMSTKDDGSSKENQPRSIPKNGSSCEDIDFKEVILKTSTPSNSKIESLLDIKALEEETSALKEELTREARSAKKPYL